MWYLTSDTDFRVIYVVETKKVTIGRSVDAQNCNFAVPDDPSLSRKHASLVLSGNDLVLQDLGSKYGTYVNNCSQKIECDVLHKLNSGDVVKFGKMNCMWKVNHVHFVTCTSTLKGENLQSLRTNLTQLGVTLKSEWDDTCNYLTMPAITLTIKVVLALVQGAHIVSTDFWNKCIEATNNNTPLPNPNAYIPQIVESTLNKENVSFVPNEQRQTLFNNKKFIFFSKRQLEMYKAVLRKSSATPLLLSESRMSKSALCDSNVIVIQYNITSTSQESQAQRDQIMDIVNYLKSNKKRIVADAEIGLAILYCSTSKYCNPDFNFSSEVIKQVDQSDKSNKILAPESQEPKQRLQEKENIVINESLHFKNEYNNGTGLNIDFKGKRKIEDDANDSHVHKKMISGSEVSFNESKKRAAEEELNHTSKKVALEHDDDAFNFVTANSNENSDVTNKKLNLTKSSKRKFLNEDNDEDNLFNFVESKKPCTPQNSLSTNTKEQSKIPVIAQNIKVNEVNVAKLRGSKLQELMAGNSKNIKIRDIKEEDLCDLDEKFSSIDIGSTTIVIRSDLIIKKEPLEIKTNDVKVKNFKKFKKVWPVKMQVSIIS